MREKPDLLIFASGTSNGGGSGFLNLVKHSLSAFHNYNVVGVVSNHLNGGVREKADREGVRFIHFEGPWTAEKYQQIANDSGAKYFALSGWLKKVKGLDLNTVFNSRTVFNIHPGPLPNFGGIGMHGIHVHEAVLKAYKNGEINYSQVCMHFVTEEFDQGPVFFIKKVPIKNSDTPQSLAERVNKVEHIEQPNITELVVNEKITWDGINPRSLKFPSGYMKER